VFLWESSVPTEKPPSLLRRWCPSCPLSLLCSGAALAPSYALQQRPPPLLPSNARNQLHLLSASSLPYQCGGGRGPRGSRRLGNRRRTLDGAERRPSQGAWADVEEDQPSRGGPMPLKRPPLLRSSRISTSSALCAAARA
jgi:hypothetical protein